MSNQTSNHKPALRQMLDGARNVVVTCHHSPDGDALAAILGLSGSLRLARWNPVAISPSPVPASYHFLPGWEEILVYRSDGPDAATNPAAREVLLAADLIISLDCSDMERLGHIYSENRAKLETTPLINIDHHASNSLYGTLNLVDPSAASACEYLVLLLEDQDLPITTETASVLLVGIVADTLGFRTGATSATTLRVAASLMEHGASLSQVSEAIFNKRSGPALKLWGRVLSRARVEGRLVWSDITREMLEESGATLADADMLVDFIAGVPGSSGAVLFSEQDGRVRVSMRTSRDFNASDLARHFGGGGHPRAAGCTVEGPMAEVQRVVLEEARRRLDSVEPGSEGQPEIDA